MFRQIVENSWCDSAGTRRGARDVCPSCVGRHRFDYDDDDDDDDDADDVMS